MGRHLWHDNLDLYPPSEMFDWFIHGTRSRTNRILKHLLYKVQAVEAQAKAV